MLLNETELKESPSGSSMGHEELSTSPVWHTLAIDDAFNRLESDHDLGLTTDEATSRRARCGTNELPQAAQRSAWAILIAQFQSLVVVLLVVATGIAFATNEILEAFSILVVVVINAAIGFFTEWQAQRALSALQQQSVKVTQVIRDGKQQQIPAVQLVPGDLVVLTAGSHVPADGRIIEASRLQIEEAALTGESLPVEKSIAAIDDQNLALGDRRNMAFLGTTVTDGHGRLLVTAIGSQTEIGRIGSLIERTTTRASPLERQLDRLGKTTVLIVSGLCSIIVLAGWLHGALEFWQMLTVGISLAIAAVPEGLPAATTMTLAIGMQRMARMRALVRQLPAVETLGSVTVICTDKTGTLTRNEMTVCVVELHGRTIDVMESGTRHDELFVEHGTTVSPQSDRQLAQALRIGILCNDARLDPSGEHHRILGDPTEAALIVAGEKAGMHHSSLQDELPRIEELPFDSVSKRMVTVHRTSDGSKIAFFKGSPGTLLIASDRQLTFDGVVPLSADDRLGWEERNKQLASGALRVLGLAYREMQDSDSVSSLDKGLIFVGLVGMSDPLRDEARSAIATCRSAGIRTIMITGDQPVTATEIARQLGIDRDLDGRPLQVIHGRDLADLDAAGWQRVVTDAAVFARVSPEHKLRIVEALQQQGQIVAMTGDGVNDAPAMKKADIGIAMGMKGTEVAKENADLVITDDNFASIVNAVEQGRIIYDNLLRFIHYLFSCNFSEVLTFFFALMIGWPVPLAAMQILWLNLVTDVFPAFALALEPSVPEMMKRSPRDPRKPFLTASYLISIAWKGILLALITLVSYGIGLYWHGTGDGLPRASTIAFMTLALTQVFHVFNERSRERSMFSRRLTTNIWLWSAVVLCVFLQFIAVAVPLLRRVLHTVYPTPGEWALIAVCSLSPVVVVEVVKFVRWVFGRRLGLV